MGEFPKGGIIGKTVHLAQRYSRMNISLYAANASFFIILSVFPLLLVLLGLIQYTPLGVEPLGEMLEGVLPETLLGPAEELILTTYDKASSASALGLSAVTALWSSGRGIYALMTGLNAIDEEQEYRSYLRDILMEQAKESFENDKLNAAIMAIEENTVFTDVPGGMLNRMNETLTANISAYANAYGMDIGTYVANVYGGSADAYQDTLLEQARITAQRYIMMSAIADEEGIEVTDEELEAGISEETANYAGYGYTSEEEYTETIDKEAYREYLLIQKVADFLAENTVAGSKGQNN